MLRALDDMVAQGKVVHVGPFRSSGVAGRSHGRAEQLGATLDATELVIPEPLLERLAKASAIPLG